MGTAAVLPSFVGLATVRTIWQEAMEGCCDSSTGREAVAERNDGENVGSVKVYQSASVGVGAARGRKSHRKD